MENKIKQMRKGILELVILGALENNRHYGYSLIKTISEGVDILINEGTIYPILSRLSKEGLIGSEWIESNQGPPRKYYVITHEGLKTARALRKEFSELIRMVENSRIKKSSSKKSKGSKSLKVKKEVENVT